MTPGPQPRPRPSTTHLALEATQYVLLAIVSVLIAVIVIATFMRIVKQPVPIRNELPQVTTTVTPADLPEAVAPLLIVRH